MAAAGLEIAELDLHRIELVEPVGQQDPGDLHRLDTQVLGQVQSRPGDVMLAHTHEAGVSDKAG